MSQNRAAAPIRLKDLDQALVEGKLEVTQFRPSNLPDLPLFELEQERSDFGERGPVIEKQLATLELNIQQLGLLLLDPATARASTYTLDELEGKIFNYAWEVLPEKWRNERSLFFVRVIQLMIQYYPPFVWDKIDAEMRAWVLEGLGMDPKDVKPGNAELMERVQCVESAHQSLGRIGTMGVKLGVFQAASGKTMPQQTIRIKAPVGSGGRMVVTNMVCHFDGAAGLTQPLRQMIKLLVASRHASFQRELAGIKEGTISFVEAIRRSNGITMITHQNEKYNLPHNGGYIRLKIEEGWIHPVAAIGKISRSRKWRMLMEDGNSPSVHVNNLGKRRVDSSERARLPADTFANVVYFLGVLNRAFGQLGESVVQISEEGEARKEAVTISLEEWLHPQVMLVGTAFASRAQFKHKGAEYRGVESVLERKDGGDIRVAWCNDDSAQLFKGADEFADEYDQPKSFQDFLNALHHDLGLPDVKN